MDISGQNVRLWANEHTKADGTKWYDYSVSVSKKKQDGTYVRTYMKVRFTEDANAPAKIENGTKMDFAGFLSVDEYESRGELVRKPMIVITSVVFPDLEIETPNFAAVDDDGFIPF